MNSGNREKALQARQKLLSLVFGPMAGYTVAAASRIGLADLIGDREVTAGQVAEECDADASSMHRLLRVLAALGLLTEQRAGEFSLTAVGALLRTDRPDSMHAFVDLFTDPVVLQPWQRLEGSVRSGHSAFEEVYGTSFFDYVKANPEFSTRFNAAMSQTALVATPGLPAAYDFGRFHTVVDVGGGDGTQISAILRNHQSLKGILFDTPEGLARAGEVLAQAGVSERCGIRAGDFFDSVPAGGDLYLLKGVIHDWDDRRATAILRNCRTAMGERGRLLIIESVLPAIVDGSITPLAYLSDLNMLVNLGGLGRTEAGFAQLCRWSGFELIDVSPLPPPAMFSLIEAAPA